LPVIECIQKNLGPVSVSLRGTITSPGARNISLNLASRPAELREKGCCRFCEKINFCIISHAVIGSLLGRILLYRGPDANPHLRRFDRYDVKTMIRVRLVEVPPILNPSPRPANVFSSPPRARRRSRHGVSARKRNHQKIKTCRIHALTVKAVHNAGESGMRKSRRTGFFAEIPRLKFLSRSRFMTFGRFDPKSS